MEKYLTLEQAADYLGVSPETIKRYVERGQLPVYKLDRALRFRFEDLDALLTKNLEVLLTRGLRANARHSTQAQEGVGAWRVIIKFIDTTTKDRLIIPFGPDGKFTEYYVWITEEYLEDFAKQSPDISGAEKFALQYIQERFEETKDKNGDRDIKKITENTVLCASGKCVRGKELPLPVPKEENTINN